MQSPPIQKYDLDSLQAAGKKLFLISSNAESEKSLSMKPENRLSNGNILKDASVIPENQH